MDENSKKQKPIVIYIVKVLNGYKIVCSGFHDAEPMHWDSMDSQNAVFPYHIAKIRAKSIRRTFRNMYGGYIATKVIDGPESDSLHFPAKELVSTEALLSL